MHYGLLLGLLVALAAWAVMRFTPLGLALRVAGGNARTALGVGLPVATLTIGACAAGGACAGLAGAVEVAAVHGAANASLIAGYGYTGILIAFAARFSPAGVVPVAILVGGIAASGSLLQRRLGLPDASVHGAARLRLRRADRLRDAARPLASSTGHAVSDASALGWWGVPLAILGGAIRVGTPLLWVSLGETVTEKAGRINLGLEGTLLMGAMTAFARLAGQRQPWLGVLAAAGVGVLLGALHGALCSLNRVNDTAMGIALMLAGSGLAFWLGKPLIQPSAPGLPPIALGDWSRAAPR